jgi:flagellar hook protein FlgE
MQNQQYQQWKAVCMSISSSMNAGVAGLNANATRLSTISDNIANSSTYGYRRVNASFHSMVLSGSTSGMYSAGGVRTTTTRLIDQGGPLINTTNSTDIAVSGRGFLPVTSSVAVSNANGDLPLMLTSTGSFRPDATGMLRNETGMVLLGWPANIDGTMGSFPRDTVGGLEPVQINTNQYAGDPTGRISLGLNLPATATRPNSDGASHELSIEYFSSLGGAKLMNMTFTPTIDANGQTNEWSLTVTDSDNGDAVVGEYTLAFSDGLTDGGTIASVTQPAGGLGGAYNAATGAFSIDINGQPLEVTIGAPGETGGISQLSSSFAPVAINKDGAPVGELTGVVVDENGFLQAVYDQGYTRTIYQIPLIDVPNPNGLTSINNQAYQVSRESGAFFLWDAGDGPTGEVVGFALEESSTDVAAELTQMIRTQRAYSSNAKVIQTADEMLQETTNIKR